MRYILQFLKKMNNVFKDPEIATICIPSIKMINSDFKVGKGIRQRKFYNCLVSEYKLWQTDKIQAIHSIDYNPDKYPGINIKFLTSLDNLQEIKKTRKGRKRYPGEITILIFRSGSIIITGGTKPEEFNKAFKFIVNKLALYKEQVLFTL